MSIFTKAQRLGPAALLMAGSVFLSRFMGLARDKVISYYYGAGPDTDIYNASFAIPDFINYLLAGGYFSITLIPLLARYFKDSEDDGWNFFSSAFWWVVIAIVSVTGLAWIFAPELAYLAAPGFDAASRAKLVDFLRIILPAQACFLPGACFTALLVMRRQFTVPALTPLVYNGCIILTGLLFTYAAPERGIEGFSWGVLLGATLGSLVIPYLAARAGGLNLKPVLLHPGLKRFVLLALPLMLGQSIVVLDEQFVRIFGSLGPEGSISHLNYARRLMMVPVGVVAQAAGVASYPFLAALAAQGDKPGFDRTVNRALLTTIAVIIPLSAWMISVATPTIRLIFEQGRFSAEATEASSLLLAIMLTSTAFWAVQQVLGRGFYANENTMTPVLAGTAATACALPFYYLGAVKLGAPGVALAGVVSLGFYTVFMLWRWHTHFGGSAIAGLGRRILAVTGLSLPCALLSWQTSGLVEKFLPAHPLLSAFFAICAGMTAFMIFFAPLARLLLPDVWRETIGTLIRRNNS